MKTATAGMDNSIFSKKIKKSFADIKNVYIFAMSIKTKPTGRVAGTKKLRL